VRSRWGSDVGPVRVGEGQLRDSDEGQGGGRREADEGRLRTMWGSQVRDSGEGLR
jgi:hypothetical protein